MNKIRPYIFIVLLAGLAILLGFNYFIRPFESAQQKQEQNKMAKEKELEELLIVKKSNQDILDQLSSRERVLQMIAYPVVVTDELEIPETKNGFFTLFGDQISMELATNTISSIKQNNQVYELPTFIAVDHEGGSVQRLNGEGFSQLNSWRDVCALSPSQRDAVLKQSANELKKAGIDVVLAPILDVGRNPVLKDRICTLDSYPVIADSSMDYTTIFSNLGILTVLKHFPGIGQTKKDLHKSYEYISVLENDVKLYKYVLDQNERIGVMTSHVGVASQDPEIPCSVSPYCVSELNQAYPDVLVFTDALEMESAAYNINNPLVPKELDLVSKQAVEAGNDVLIYGPSVTHSDLDVVVGNLTKEYENNSQFKSYVDQSVLKIIEYKYE
jgi:beta-glucosidase-like glycosyl hydrolase